MSLVLCITVIHTWIYTHTHRVLQSPKLLMRRIAQLEDDNGSFTLTTSEHFSLLTLPPQPPSPASLLTLPPQPSSPAFLPSLSPQPLSPASLPSLPPQPPSHAARVEGYPQMYIHYVVTKHYSLVPRLSHSLPLPVHVHLFVLQPVESLGGIW